MLLAHPGGPFFEGRDLGHWTIPKGEPADGDDVYETAGREFEEETGHALAAVARDPAAPPIDLGSVVQASGKRVLCWAVEGNLDPAAATSNTFELVWPPGSGRPQHFLEIDEVAWFGVPEALRRANPSQAQFVRRLVSVVRPGVPPA